MTMPDELPPETGLSMTNKDCAKLDVLPGTQVGEFHWQDGWTIRREGMRIRIRKYNDATCREIVDDTYIDFDDWISIMEAACGEPSEARRRYLTALCIVDGWAEGALRAIRESKANSSVPPETTPEWTADDERELQWWKLRGEGGYIARFARELLRLRAENERQITAAHETAAMWYHEAESLRSELSRSRSESELKT